MPAEYESRPQNIPGAGLHGRRRRVALLPRGYFSDESRRRRGCDVDIPRYKPRRRGYSVETSRGDTATIPSEYPARSRGVAATVPLTISQVPCRRKTARVPASPFHRGRARGAGALERGGRTPVNPGGGLIGGGHPVGATGVRMLIDATAQVSGDAGEFQVEGARRAATLNIGGSTASTCFTRRKRDIC